MEPKWVIEDFEPDNSYGILANEVKRQGMPCEIVKYEPFQSGSFNAFNDDDCVILQASINIVLQLQKQKKWIPGAWFTIKNYECSKYYAYLGKYLFNDLYIMLPRAEVERQIDWLYQKCFGQQEDLFFRPSSGLKPWTAGLFSRERFNSDWKWAKEFSEPDSPVVVSTPKVLKTEWRFVCTKGEVITGCQYGCFDKFAPAKGYPEKAKDLALEISLIYQPDPVFIIDICQANDDKYYLMELNSFSCGGLYACDVEKIVKRVSEIAVKEYVENNSLTFV
jgi:hypothetical protein